MATETIEAVWKGGKFVPLEGVTLEENTKIVVTINLPTRSKSISLAGAWKDYRTKDKKTLDDLKKEIYDSRKVSSRKEVSL